MVIYQRFVYEEHFVSDLVSTAVQSFCFLPCIFLLAASLVLPLEVLVQLDYLISVCQTSLI